MTGLVLPRHVAEARAQQRAAGMADTISGKSKKMYDLETDEFITPDQVRQQLATLNDYVRGAREVHAGYRLPQPVGWKLCVLLLTLPEVTDGGLELVSDTLAARALASPQGVVLSFGPSCYTDPDRFTVNGELTPWTKRGDRVTWTRYDVSTFTLSNRQLLGFLTDTQPVSIIDEGWEVPE